MNKDIDNNYICDTNESCGILMEKVICEISNIEFNSKRDYINKIPIDILNDIKNLNIIEPLCIVKHCGNENKYYDFLTKDNKTVSLKTNISTNKICPANIGQTSLKQFNIKCREFGVVTDYKKLVLNNTIDVINMYLKNLFLCDIIIYINFNDNKIYIIKNKFPILNKDIIYKFSKTIDTWNESITFYIEFNKNGYHLQNFKFIKTETILNADLI